MNFDENGGLQNLRIDTATRLCQGLLAHHGHYGKLDEFVADAYKVTDEILKQGNPAFMNRETESQAWRREVNITNQNYHNIYGDNVI
jgi:hypothetical protein